MKISKIVLLLSLAMCIISLCTNKKPKENKVNVEIIGKLTKMDAG